MAKKWEGDFLHQICDRNHINHREPWNQGPCSDPHLSHQCGLDSGVDLIWWPPWHSSSPKPWKSNRFFWWWMFHGVPLLWFFLLVLQHSIPGYLTTNMPAPKWARFESLKRSSLLTVFPLLTMIKTCCGWDGHATILISCRLCYAPLSPGTVWSYFLLTIKPDLE